MRELGNKLFPLRFTDLNIQLNTKFRKIKEPIYLSFPLMKKSLYRSRKGEFHLGGVIPGSDFVPATLAELQKALAKPGKKQFWKCKVCGDIHFGIGYPSPCPTCKAVESYEKITAQEAKKILGLGK